MDEWGMPLFNFAVLFLAGALGGLGSMFGGSRTITAGLIAEVIFKNGSWGAGVGICVIEKLGKSLAIGASFFVGAGVVGKKEIGEYIRRWLGVDEGRNANEPTSPPRVDGN